MSNIICRPDNEFSLNNPWKYLYSFEFESICELSNLDAYNEYLDHLTDDYINVVVQEFREQLKNVIFNKKKVYKVYKITDFL